MMQRKENSSSDVYVVYNIFILFFSPLGFLLASRRLFITRDYSLVLESGTQFSRLLFRYLDYCLDL